jgi:hypothetical protein
MKVTIVRMLERRYVIHFLLKDELAAKEIPGPLSQVYEADAIKKAEVLYWIREIRAGCEDLSDETRPSRQCQINLDTVLVHKLELELELKFELELELDPHMTARKLALSLFVSLQIVTNHLDHNLGMKCYHLQWIPHVLDDSQKRKGCIALGSCLKLSMFMFGQTTNAS